MTNVLVSRAVLITLVTAGLMSTGCGKDDGQDSETMTSLGPGIGTGVTITGTETGIDPTESSTTNDEEKLDLPVNDTEDIVCAGGDGSCNLVDLLFVIDNSGTMGEEQINLANNFSLLVDRLENLKDAYGVAVNPDVNIMVTTTDFGHPLCTEHEKPDYDPAKGAPISTPCTQRLSRFTGLTNPPVKVEEACTNFCTTETAPTDPYIHFGSGGSNVPGGDAAMALNCLGPQGIDGCGMESPLESMLQALDPNKPWNNGTDGKFLRDGALLALVLVTDEADCSVNNYDYFDPANSADPELSKYWNIDPNDQSVKPTSAVCWNAGTSCTDGDLDGVYESCDSLDNGVLHPTTRYINYLTKELVENQKKNVIMLGILGVPEVTAHNEEAPFEPIAGGVESLEYREWNEADILPGDPDANAATKKFKFGIGPGCTQANTGQAIPPVRVKEVCESLNIPDDPETNWDESEPRCCIESICSEDFSPAIECLSGILQQAIPPVG
ncbi:MAG: hypothetical protein ACPG4T_01195 [Nannocystaceae bacterium]